MKRVSVGKASRSLGAYAAELEDEIVVMTQGTRAVAALVPLRHVDRESLELSSHPEFLGLVRRARAEVAAGKTLALEAARRAVAAKPAIKRLRTKATKRRRG